METKVDLAALVGGGPRNSTTGRAPLADGAEEVAGPTPVVPSEPEVTGAPVKFPTLPESSDKYGEMPFDSFNTDENRPDRGDALVSVDEDGKPSGVLVSAKEAADLYDELMPSKEKTELELLRDMVENLTKRLEDFGAIPREADLKPYVPVVTTTKAGNKRTDW